MEKFYCISYFDGDCSWVKTLSDPYIVYNKSGSGLEHYDNVVDIPNVGYNISSYLRFIIENYDALPDVTVFCKNNVFPRHVSREIFDKISREYVFSPIHDASSWENMVFPVSGVCNSGYFLEINNSWYCSNYDRKFFSSYNDFYSFIFGTRVFPMYISFSPGANFVVPREHLLLRTKCFYENLLVFVDHSQFSCESHFVERSLLAIWSSTQATAVQMNSPLSKTKQQELTDKCMDQVSSESRLIMKVRSSLYVFFCRLAGKAFL